MRMICYYLLSAQGNEHERHTFFLVFTSTLLEKAYAHRSVSLVHIYVS